MVPTGRSNLKVARYRRRRTGLSKLQPTQEHPAAWGLTLLRGDCPRFLVKWVFDPFVDERDRFVTTRTASEGHATVGAAAVLRLVPRRPVKWGFDPFVDERYAITWGLSLVSCLLPQRGAR